MSLIKILFCFDDCQQEGYQLNYTYYNNNLITKLGLLFFFNYTLLIECCFQSNSFLGYEFVKKKQVRLVNFFN